MPFKANRNRRHHIPKQRHRVTNWAAYDAGLRARGSLTGSVSSCAGDARIGGAGQAWIGS